MTLDFFDQVAIIGLLASFTVSGGLMWLLTRN